MRCGCTRTLIEYQQHYYLIRSVAKKYAVKHGIIVAIFKTCTTGVDFREFASGDFRTADLEYLTPYD